MSEVGLHALCAAAAPHAYSLAACAARLVPVAFLCPVLGAQAGTWISRLSLCLGLAIAVHFGGGVTAPSAEGAWAAVWLIGREATLGVAIGLLASLPFDAARIGGRLADTVRGTSAEASLPFAGSREAASGDLLYQLLVAVAVCGGAASGVTCGLVRSFRVVPLGAFLPAEAPALKLAGLLGAAMATGFAIGAPVIGCSLAVEAAVGFAARAAGGSQLAELAAPARILLGAAAMWLSLGAICERLLAGAWGVGSAMASVLGAAP